MSQITLKWLRLITPGVIIVIFFALMGKTTGLWSVEIPKKFDDLNSSLGVLFVAGFYYILPFREWSNSRYFNEVTSNLRTGLIKASKLPDDPEVFTWKAIRGLFYSFVDNDNSLSKKSTNAYFNGFIWTTLADIRALSILFALISIVLGIFVGMQAFLSAPLFLLIALLTAFGSNEITRKHKEIGEEQIEIIEHHYKKNLVDKLEEIRNRSDQ